MDSDDKYMVLTVGMGAGVEEGLAHSIKSHNPDVILPMVTERTLEVLEQRLKPLVGVYVDRFTEPCFFEDQDDVEKCTLDCRAAIIGLVEQGAGLEDIVVDFTSGTKAMSAGLCIAACLLEVDRISYVAGKRDPETGRVISGSERVITMQPSQFLIINRRGQLRTFFNKRLFVDGTEVIEEIAGYSTGRETDAELVFWKNLFDTYYYWDAFDHGKAHESIRKLNPQVLSSYGLDLKDNWDMIKKIDDQRRLRKRMEDEGAAVEDIARYRYTVEMLADILANAERRRVMGRYDDAVGRYYRSCELIAQIALAQEYGIDTGELKPEDIPKKLSYEFSDIIKKGYGVVGLKKAYRLLAEVDRQNTAGETRARMLLDSDELEESIQARNSSIYAHGDRPATKEDCEAFGERVNELARSFFPELEILIPKCVFPTIEVVL